MTNANPTPPKLRIEPGIYRKANGRIIVRYRDGARVRDRTFDTLDKARRFKAAIGKNATEVDSARRDPIHLDDDTVERLADAIARRLEVKP